MPGPSSQAEKGHDDHDDAYADHDDDYGDHDDAYDDHDNAYSDHDLHDFHDGQNCGETESRCLDLLCKLRIADDGDVAAVKDDDDSLRRIPRLHVLVTVVNIFYIN